MTATASPRAGHTTVTNPDLANVECNDLTINTIRAGHDLIVSMVETKYAPNPSRPIVTMAFDADGSYLATLAESRYADEQIFALAVEAALRLFPVHAGGGTRPH